MKKSLLSLCAALSLSSQVAFAAPQMSVMHVYSCRALHGNPDSGWATQVDYDMGSRRLVAKVMESTFAGLVEKASYTVKQKQSKAIGAPLQYIGRGYSLDVQTTSTPIQGGHFGHLTAELNGQRVSEDMVCYRTR